MKVPFRNLLLFPNQAPWPGRLGDQLIPLNFRCRTRTRDSQNTSDVPHMLSVNCLYQGSGLHASESLTWGKGNEFGSAVPARPSLPPCGADSIASQSTHGLRVGCILALLSGCRWDFASRLMMRAHLLICAGRVHWPWRMDCLRTSFVLKKNAMIVSPRFPLSCSTRATNPSSRPSGSATNSHAAISSWLAP